MASYWNSTVNDLKSLCCGNDWNLFLKANSEVSALLGRIPSAVGYQPTLATDLGGLQERITATKKGSITSVQAIYLSSVGRDCSEFGLCRMKYYDCKLDCI